MVAAATLSSDRQDWETPEEVLSLVRRVAPIALDPCTTPANPVGAKQWLTPAEDGLSVHWQCGGLVYVNSPYGRDLPRWLVKCALEQREADEEYGPSRQQTIALCPSRTDTTWWQGAYESANALCFWRGRIRFVGADAGAPFPSCLFYWGNRPHRFADVFRKAGIVEVLR